MIEIGAGRGALTKSLAECSRRLVAVEMDAYLAARLQRAFGDRIEVVAGDFLEVPLPDEPYCAVGNLPYAITTAIVRKLTAAANPPRDAWLVVQKELAHRLCGRPYTGESLASLRLKPCWHVEIVDRLRRTDFVPPPSVDSVLLWLRRRERPLLFPAEMALYLQTVESALPAATMSRALRGCLSKRQLQRLAADLCFGLDDPPSSLAFEQWLGILRFLHRARPPGTSAARLESARRTDGGEKE